MPAWGGPLRTPKNWFFERFYIIKSNWKSSSLFCLLFPLASCCRTLPIDILSTIFWSMQEHHLNILSTEFWSMGQIYSMYKFFFSVAVLNPYHILSTSRWLYIYIYISRIYKNLYSQIKTETFKNIPSPQPSASPRRHHHHHSRPHPRRFYLPWMQWRPCRAWSSMGYTQQWVWIRAVEWVEVLMSQADARQTRKHITVISYIKIHQKSCEAHPVIYVIFCNIYHIVWQTAPLPISNLFDLQ